MLYLISVYLHILSAIIWIGGIAFLVLVVVPWLRAGGQQIAGVFLRETGARFRSIGWICFAVLVVTGSFNLWVRGVRFSSFVEEAWLASSFGRTVMLKIAVFVAVLVTSAFHDFVVGPRATAAILADGRSADAARLRRLASLLGRLNALFAITLLGIAITLVRGCPNN